MIDVYDVKWLQVLCNYLTDDSTAESLDTNFLSMLDKSGEKLSSFIMWEISSAVEADSATMLHSNQSHQCFTTIPEEKEVYRNSLISKLLRWLTATVILGKLDWKSMLTRHVEEGAKTDMVVKRSWHQQFSTFNSFLEQITKCYLLSLLPLAFSFPVPPFMQVSCMIMKLSNHFG